MSYYYIQFERLKYWAAKGLTQNIQDTGDGAFLSAGPTHFRSLWTRDFAWSINGLLEAGHTHVVRNHLESLLRFAEPETALIPRVLKTFPTIVRVACVTLIRNAPQVCGRLPLTGPLLAEYKGEHGTIALDSNVLTVLSAIWFFEHTNDTAWWNAHKAEVLRIFTFYKSRLKNDLVIQGSYEDWQDSVTRNGHTFYINLLVSVAARKLRDLIPDVDLSWLRDHDDAIENAFKDPSTGLYLSWKDKPHISLDGNLLALDLAWIRESERVNFYTHLKNHPLWSYSRIPGCSTFPDYPKKEKSRITRFAGLLHYHDRAVWLWLSALAAEVAWEMNDIEESVRILSEIERIAERDHGLAEIYTQNMEPFTSYLYLAEFPFSWSSAKVLETLGRIEKLKTARDNIS